MRGVLSFGEGGGGGGGGAAKAQQKEKGPAKAVVGGGSTTLADGEKIEVTDLGDATWNDLVW